MFENDISVDSDGFFGLMFSPFISFLFLILTFTLLYCIVFINAKKAC